MGAAPVAGQGVSGGSDASEWVADLLKERTWPAHQAAERHGFQRAMLTGEAGLPPYLVQMQQMLLVHRDLEQALHARPTERIGAVYKQYHDRSGLIEADLATLGSAPAAEALPSTRRMLETMSACRISGPDRLLGVLYVLEGSTNGGRYIARAIEKSYGLESRRGTSWLDPHGEEQRPRWKQFRRDISAQEWGQAELEELGVAADATFRFAAELMDDLATAR